MPETRHTDRPRITLEQLLALKRSERPEPSFWEEFDRELHRRQLASVVARPAWYVRAARGMGVGLRRMAPVALASAAAVAGFLVLQQPGSEEETADVAVTADVSTPAVTVAMSQPDVAAATLPVTDEPLVPVPAFERPVTSETRLVVHEFVAATKPARTFVSVSSPNTFSSPAYDASLQMVNTLNTGSLHSAGMSSGAGRF
jgi:hypothetical protein